MRLSRRLPVFQYTESAVSKQAEAGKPCLTFSSVSAIMCCTALA